MKDLLFDSWKSVGNIAILSLLAYLAVVFLLRITGKRTLSKMNAFDFVVTIALGSSIASVVLNNKVALADGLTLIFMLIILQFIITFISVRVKSFKKLITGTPTLLLYKGELFENVLRQERILKEELFVVARSKGISNLGQVDAIILETNGELTVIEDMKEKAETINDVERKKDPGQL